MKVAITSKEPNLTSKVSLQFTNSKYWIIFDTCDKSFEIFTNRGNTSDYFESQSEIVNRLSNKNIDIVVSGYISQGSLRALIDADIKHYNWRDDTISDVIEMIEKELNISGNDRTIEIPELQLLRQNNENY